MNILVREGLLLSTYYRGKEPVDGTPVYVTLFLGLTRNVTPAVLLVYGMLSTAFHKGKSESLGDVANAGAGKRHFPSSQHKCSWKSPQSPVCSWALWPPH